MGKIDSEKIAEKITDTWISKPSNHGLKDIAKALDEAYQRGRDEMREECINLLQDLARDKCPECGGIGWYAQQVSDTEQEQRKCDNCHAGEVEVCELNVNHVLEVIRSLK